MEKPKSLVEQHWPEAALGLVSLIGIGIAKADRRISPDAADIIDVIVATLAIYIGILKGHFARGVESIGERRYELDSRTGQISSVLESLSGPDFYHAVEFVDATIEKLRCIPEGILQLEASAYYNELSDMLKSVKRGSHVCAASSMPIERWDHDPRQKNYFQQNIIAAGRGVLIHRVFLIEKARMQGEYSSHVKQIIKSQKEAKIKCQLVWREAILNDSLLYDDFVLFSEKNIAFTDEHEKVDPTRVKAGYRITNNQRLERYRGVFQSLTTNYCDQKALDELLS